ncbi:glycosyl transferase family 2 [Motilibacter rhizosphaerae]|uniref:Glycosyl transferase family 2 n=1 Tax=Motilibacter rhizosphaerae TaxID=598652 RepID=A0A4Q7NYE0_9ACTN|nr:glycosyltransferase [Motilibacter rhizosphaerae]RZS91412.1 glycosyl transferase family 2 [Motilibacter rhizosphaerae]
MAPLAVVLIVKDEESRLAGALASLAPLRSAGLVDLVRVHDTGSRDATVAVARAAGADVTAGEWEGSFAAARTAALAGVDRPWVLSLDADERVHADPAALAALLGAVPADLLTVEIANRSSEGDYRHRAERLFRPERARWEGRVHEHLVPTAAPSLRTAAAPAGVVRLEHEGYSGAAVRVEKCLRNAELARRELEDLLGARNADPAAVARVLLDLGRSCAGAERPQEAVDAFEALRETAPGTTEALQGTDALARLLLGAGMDEVVLVLVAELREAGAAPAYCDWLEAQARAQLGEVATAARLLRGVHEVVDTAGRILPAERLRELRGLVEQLAA